MWEYLKKIYKLDDVEQENPYGLSKFELLEEAINEIERKMK